MTINLLDRETRKPRLLAEQCATCVGRPGNANLGPGRLRQLVKENTGDGRMGLVCHETIVYGSDDDGNETHGGKDNALCRWFYDHFGHLANGIRVMERLGGFTEVPPPGKEEDDERTDNQGTPQAC